MPMPRRRLGVELQHRHARGLRRHLVRRTAAEQLEPPGLGKHFGGRARVFTLTRQGVAVERGVDQVIFLQHVFAEKIPPLVPVLCGEAGSLLARASRPSGLPGVDGALELMREAVGGAGLVVAGVDLVHVGPKFGDADPASSILPDALEHESALLDALESADAEAFWAEAAKVEDRYNVCGLSSLGVLLETLPDGSRGVLLGRDVMREHDTNSAVGFASMAVFAP